MLFRSADSGARGSKTQLRQLGGMRGLMADMSCRNIAQYNKAHRGIRCGGRRVAHACGTWIRSMSGYVLHVDLSPVRELVSLQRRCSNNLNQVAIQANTYGAIYPEELAALQRDYAALWGPLSDLLKQLSALVEL